MLFSTTGVETAKPETIITSDELMSYQRLVRQIPVPEKVVEMHPRSSSARRGPAPAAGGDTDQTHRLGPRPARLAGPHARHPCQGLLDGRLAPSIDDVIALADHVLKHRMALSFAARAEGVTMADVIAKLTQPLA